MLKSGKALTGVKELHRDCDRLWVLPLCTLTTTGLPEGQDQKRLVHPVRQHRLVRQHAPGQRLVSGFTQNFLCPVLAKAL